MAIGGGSGVAIGSGSGHEHGVALFGRVAVHGVVGEVDGFVGFFLGDLAVVDVGDALDD